MDFIADYAIIMNSYFNEKIILEKSFLSFGHREDWYEFSF